MADINEELNNIDLIINELSEARLHELESLNALEANQYYLTPDIEEDDNIQAILNDLIERVAALESQPEIIVDAILDSSSTNPVQNKVITQELSTLITTLNNHTHSYSAVYTGGSATQSSNTTLSNLRIGYVSNNLYIWNS